MTERKRAIKQLVKLCEKTARKIVKEEVDIIIADEFAALTPLEGEREDITLAIYLDIVGEKKKVIKGHQLVENEVYFNPANGYSYFTQSFFHEVGHLKTLKFFKNDAVQDWNDTFQDMYMKGAADLRNYKLLPHELLADVWSMFLYIPKNQKKVERFDRKVKKLLKKIY